MDTGENVERSPENNEIPEVMNIHYDRRQVEMPGPVWNTFQDEEGKIPNYLKIRLFRASTMGRKHDDTYVFHQLFLSIRKIN